LARRGAREMVADFRASGRKRRLGMTRARRPPSALDVPEKAWRSSGRGQLPVLTCTSSASKTSVRLPGSRPRWTECRRRLAAGWARCAASDLNGARRRFNRWLRLECPFSRPHRSWRNPATPGVRHLQPADEENRRSWGYFFRHAEFELYPAGQARPKSASESASPCRAVPTELGCMCTKPTVFAAVLERAVRAKRFR
jgi:hypothetical protein